MPFPPRLRLTAALTLSLLSVLASRADDWPQWRGARRDGVWRETGIPTPNGKWLS